MREGSTEAQSGSMKGGTNAGMCSCCVELYTEKRFGPANEPCGTQQSSGLSDEYERPIFTLQYLGHRYELNHFKAVWSTPNPGMEHLQEYLVVDGVKGCA